MNSNTQAVVVSPRIEELLAAGESETVEFKTRLPDAKSVARLLVAFANTRGGALIVGVDDGGKPVGLSDEEAIRTHRRLRELASAFLPSEAFVEIVGVGGRPVVYLDVPEASPNVAPLATAEGEFYVRRGTENEKVKGEDLVRAARKTADVAGGGRPTTTRKRIRKPNGRRTPLQLFIAMSFAFEEEPALVDYFEAIRRAVGRSPRQIEVRRVDLEPGDYEISQAVMDLISDADIVLADFTRSPQNVYFEAGYARGCGKPVLQTARAGTLLHFDVKTWRTTFFKNATELEEKLVSELSALVGKAQGTATSGKKTKRRRRAS